MCQSLLKWLDKLSWERQLVDPAEFLWLVAMKIPVEMPRLKGFRFPREIIAYAVWA
ncbi:hypothetical protein GCM10007928_48350 [Sulfitobacter porphyrae]|nr:hypothetical protein GCM10007928_48350 [Sulfitobacter porphyrae]